jgi:hypothetical protein
MRCSPGRAVNRRDRQAVIRCYDGLALIPTDKAAFSYQAKDRKSVRLAVRNRFRLDTFLGRQRMDLQPTLRDAFRFKFVSHGEKHFLSWRH